MNQAKYSNKKIIILEKNAVTPDGDINLDELTNLGDVTVYDNVDIVSAGGGIGAVEFLEGMWYVGGQVNNGLHDLHKCYFIEKIGSIHDKAVEE